MRGRVAIETQGCKLNQADSEALAREMADSYRRRAVGQTRPVLWERLDSWHGESALSGLTDTYLRVFASSGAQLGNRITPTRLVAARDGTLWGEPPA